MIASVTELRLRNFWCYLLFIPHAVRSHNQARKAPGNKGIQVKSQGILIQRTLTVWDDKELMLKYVRSGAHLKAMKAFPRLAHDSITTHFEVTEMPSWDHALEILKKNSKLIKSKK
jgi:hypothetical protein